MKNNILQLFTVSFLLASCAQLHHVQVGEIISHPDYVLRPFDVKVSETGVNVQEIADVSKAFMNSDRHKGADDIAQMIGYFQMGPKTGNPVYNREYARNLGRMIYEKCPSGRVTGLTSIRETRKYPVISGEIIKVTGYCLIKKGG